MRRSLLGSALVVLCCLVTGILGQPIPTFHRDG